MRGSIDCLLDYMAAVTGGRTTQAGNRGRLQSTLPAWSVKKRLRRRAATKFERLEPKLALAASAFEAGENLVLVVSDGDPLYVSETGTSPSSLLYGTNSSFVGNEDQVGVIPSLDRFTGILITEAATGDEALVVSDGTPGWGAAGATTSTVFIPKSAPYPRQSLLRLNVQTFNQSSNSRVTGVSDARTVTDTSERPLSGQDVEARGQIRVRQPDGTESNWSFTNWNQQTGNSSRFNNQAMQIVGGPGYGGAGRQYGQSSPAFSPLPAGYYLPIAIRATEFDNATVGFEVLWNRPLPPQAAPKLVLENYLRQDGIVESVNETIAAASSADNALNEIKFTLQEASGRGVVPGAITGQLYFPARNITADFFATTDPVNPDDESSSYRIHFVNSPNEGLFTFNGPNTLAFGDSKDLRQAGHPVHESSIGVSEVGHIQVTGAYDSATGIIEFAFSSGSYDDDAAYNFTGDASVGEVQLRNVRYAVFDQNLNAPTKSTIRLDAGLTLSQGLTVDMLTPGAALVVNSPVTTNVNPNAIPSASTPVEPGTLALRASSITLNADIDAESRIDIGYTTERAAGESAIDNQRTSDALGAERPAIAMPEVNEQQIARVDPVIGHRGSGYVVAPKVVVAKPTASAAAVSVASFMGGLTGVTLTNGGDGYGYNGESIDPSVTKINLIISPPDTAGLDPDGDPSDGIEYPAKSAAGYGTVENGKITSIVMTELGFGYSLPPAVSLPAPTRQKAAANNDKILNDDPANIQATVSSTFGGLITRLSIDAPGYNYDPQDPEDPSDGFPVVVDGDNTLSFEDYSNSSPDPAAFIYIQGYAGLAKTGTPTITQIVRPLVGEARSFLRIDLPPTGIAGTFFSNGKYPFQAAVDASGNLSYSFDLNTSTPPVSLGNASRPIVRAQLNSAGQIDSYTIEDGGNGYGGTPPEVFVVPPVAASSVGIVDPVVGPGSTVDRLLPASPNLVFDVAYNAASFLDADSDKPFADNDNEAVQASAVANLEIPVEESVLAYGPADLPLGNNLSADETVTLETRVSVAIQKENSDQAGTWIDLLEIPYEQFQGFAHIFEGSLVGIKSIELSVIEDLVYGGVRKDGLRNAFGEEFRLVVRTTSKATKIARDGGKTAYLGTVYDPAGEVLDFGGQGEPVDNGRAQRLVRDLSVGKSYLATGYGYAAAPTVTVQRADAASDPAEFTAVLDREGRVVKFLKVNDNGGENYQSQPQVSVTPVDSRPVVERVAFNSSIRTNIYDIRVADAAETPDTLGEVYVSSLTNIGNGASPASEFFLQADTSRVYLEGEINATRQSYLMQSPGFRELDGPFVLTTKGRDTGAISGVLLGDTVTVTLGNETTETDPLGTIVTHTFDVDTNINSLRVTAGESGVAGVFPYDIAVRDQSSLSLDAAVASSGRINLQAAGTLSVNAAIETVGDVSLGAENRVALFGPIRSRSGEISVAAGSVAVNGPIAVTEQKNRDGTLAENPNITLEATGGDLIVNAAVEGPDRVVLRQKDIVTGLGGNVFQAVNSTTDDKGKVTTSPDLNLKINDRQVTVASLTVPNPVFWERINVLMDIDHTFVGDLTGTLVAPSGERFVLFSNVGGSSNDLDNITFDSVAGRPITAAPSPFSGTYAPRDRVAPQGSIVGTWRLEVYDAFGGDTGTLNSFSLQFVNSSSQTTSPGAVFGTGVISAPAVDFVADGDIGNPSAPAQYLQLNAADVSIDSQFGGVGVEMLKAGELLVQSQSKVALSTAAADVLDNRGLPKSALQARVINPTAVGVAAARGSVDLDIVSSRTVELFGIESANAGGGSVAGNVDISVSGGDLAVLDVPIGGAGAVAVKSVFDLGGLGSFERIGDAEGEAAGVLQGAGILPAGYQVGDRLLVVNSAASSVSVDQPLGRNLFGLDRRDVNTDPEVEELVDFVQLDSSDVVDQEGNSITATAYPGWTPVAGGEFNGKRELVWRDAQNNLVVWEVNAENVWSSRQQVYRAGEASALLLEQRYGQDFDLSGTTGFGFIEGDGQSRLEKNVLADGNSEIFVNGRRVQRGDSPVIVGLTDPWQPVAAERVDGVNLLLWRNSDGRTVLWECDTNWRRIGSRPIPAVGDDLLDLEVGLHQDLNEDDIIGGFSPVGLSGRSADAYRTADGSVLVGAKLLVKNGEVVRLSDYPGWSVAGVKLTDAAGPESVLWRHQSGRLSEWQLDVNGVFQQLGTIPDDSSPDFETFENKYGLELTSTGFRTLIPHVEMTEPSAPAPQVVYGNDSATGVYEVVSVGGLVPWQLVRVEAFNTAAEVPDQTFAVDQETGKTYRIDRLAGRLGASAVRVAEVESRSTTLAIGGGGHIQYVVSSNDGTNTAPGSLGKVIGIVNEVGVESAANAIVFGMDVGTIVLEQELPGITKPVSIDTNLRWESGPGTGFVQEVVWQTSASGTVDGYRLTANGPGELLSSIAPVAVDGRQITLTAAGETIDPFLPEPVNGIVIDGVVGEGNSNSAVRRPVALRNLEIGGFSNGAAIVLSNTADILIENVVTGVGGLVGLTGNEVGISVVGSQGVTIKDSSIRANTTGVSVTDAAVGEFGEEGSYLSDQVSIVGTTVQDGLGVGIDINTKGRVSVGLAPVIGTVDVTILRGQRLLDLDSATFSSSALDSTKFFDRLYLGMPVTGNGIPARTSVVAFDPVAKEVLLSNAVTESSPRDSATGLRTATSLEFGRAATVDTEEPDGANADRNIVSGNTQGIVLRDGVHRIVNTSVLSHAGAGILLSGVGDEFGVSAKHQIGAGGVLTSGYQNIIEGNNGFGVVIAEEIVGRVSVRENAFVQTESATADNTPGNIGRRRRVSGIIRDEAFAGLSNEYQPSTSGFDANANRHFLAGNGSVGVPPEPPTITPIGDGSPILAEELVAISGTSVANATVSVFVDDVEVGRVTATSSGTWDVTVTTPLEAGIRQIYATATNDSGLVSAASDPVTVEIMADVTPPGEVTIGTTELTAEQPVISGQAEAGSRIELTLNGATFESFVDTAGTWEIDTATDLIAGVLGPLVNEQVYLVTAVAIDASGNRSNPVEKSLQVNVVPPTAPPPEPPRRPTTGF